MLQGFEASRSFVVVLELVGLNGCSGLSEITGTYIEGVNIQRIEDFGCDPVITALAKIHSLPICAIVSSIQNEY